MHLTWKKTSHTTLSHQTTSSQNNDNGFHNPVNHDHYVPSPPFPQSVSHQHQSSSQYSDSDIPDAQPESQEYLQNSPNTNLFHASLYDLCPHEKIPTLQG
eukprot:scaffold2751_cov29-Attheya_sp.AAC.1